MRVVAGSARGRQLKGPKGPGTRPVMDRVKTALFDTLAPRIRDARFLDLFAGTGGIGIEALSRGAASATFIEIGPEALKLVRENLASTRLAARAEVLRADAFAFLESAHAAARRYDIVYVAPPQYQGMAARAVARLDTAPLTEPGGLVIVQIDPRERGDLEPLTLRRLRVSDERRYGSTLLVFYEHVNPKEPSTGQEMHATERHCSGAIPS
ncbi:MAG TPA: 16S rRNA (guanine(966)-N(2))-methyltransferase RsmD [Ktedonobacterales bacterium]|nr:16S rRNA (guanine(966)-N(2))-methyltransferase RsmD [Ktedonobacterales bacterium]